jgi:transcription elongation factor/antiterminator RfaH
MKRWYAVQSLPRKENLAEQQLQNQGFSTFCPRKRRSRRIGKKALPVIEAYFPNYLFVELDIEREQWRSVNGTIGVARLVALGSRGSPAPTPLPLGFIEQLRTLADVDAVVRFDEQFKAGDKVRIMSGPFADLCGTIECAPPGERVTILMQLLSESTKVSVSKASVLGA